MSLPTPLHDAIQGRTLALFIGADLPQAVTGLPSRADLARALALRHGLDPALSLTEAAQRISQAGSRFEFTDFLRAALDTTGLAPSAFHQRLAAFVKTHAVETLITIACDNLLELACQQIGLGLNRVIRGSEVTFIRPGRPTLFKLYGDAQQPDTLVVTDRDHSLLLRDRDKEAVLDEVRRAFRRNTLLFLGYHLGDADFRFLFDQVAESRFARTAYAVWPGLPDVEIRMWRERGIVILEADPLGAADGAPITAFPAPAREVALPPTASSDRAAAANPSAGVTLNAGGDTSIGGSVVGGDQNITNITNVYYGTPPGAKSEANPQLAAAIVRCFAGDRPVGVGFLVGERHIFTCAHVVALAFGISPETAEAPLGEISLDWPLLAPGQRGAARVAAWSAARAEGGDMAGLELTSPPPSGARPIALLDADDVWDHRFRAFGFPKGLAEGVWASGVLRGRQAAGWVQIEDVKDTGYPVQSGFSGGPVWDEALNGVVGMVVAADTAARAALMIPTRLLRATWPGITEAE